MKYFNRQPRTGTIGTASGDCRVDVTVMGSPRMTDEKTVTEGPGGKGTLANLRQDPNAVFMIVEPGASIMDWGGIRVYMTLRDLTTAGPALDAYLAVMIRVAGEGVASMRKALATFEVIQSVLSSTWGQGWERSIRTRIRARRGRRISIQTRGAMREGRAPRPAGRRSRPETRTVP